ncbi:unnamed protein product [Adineta steineri]|uniref:EGF-like domain-containing protein n=1 Tax=Adineta steineri TaxID=433720 RepID=A0A815GR44_9BILA|nr:unnamed protein product [Adineta steineri]
MPRNQSFTCRIVRPGKMSSDHETVFDRIQDDIQFNTVKIQKIDNDIAGLRSQISGLRSQIRDLQSSRTFFEGAVRDIERDLGIVQLCAPGSEVMAGVGGCANKTTNTTIFSVGSRCASKPCGDRGLCSDFPSADGYHCQCDYPYTGLNCQTEYRRCPRFACGNRTSKIVPMCVDYASDKALPRVCTCLVKGNTADKHFALNNCHNETLFSLKCDGAERVGAVPFSNKAFYICYTGSINASVRPCDLDHVWNDTQKECVPEHTSL